MLHILHKLSHMPWQSSGDVILQSYWITALVRIADNLLYKSFILTDTIWKTLKRHTSNAQWSLCYWNHLECWSIVYYVYHCFHSNLQSFFCPSWKFVSLTQFATAAVRLVSWRCVPWPDSFNNMDMTGGGEVDISDMQTNISDGENNYQHA